VNIGGKLEKGSGHFPYPEGWLGGGQVGGISTIQEYEGWRRRHAQTEEKNWGESNRRKNLQLKKMRETKPFRVDRVTHWKLQRGISREVIGKL